jgi:hypothetical protein
MVGCTYLRVSEAVTARWFKKTEVPLLGKDYRLRLVTPALIEVYLSNYGVGILSIALTPETPRGIDLRHAIDFNYRLSQLRPHTSGRLRTPHPSEDRAGWERLSMEQRQEVTVAPDPDAHVFERLGRSGGALMLVELVEELVRPLDELGLEREQEQLSVYTVVRFGSDVDFGDQSVRHSLAAFMSALAQVEEPRHAGSPEGTVTVSNSVLNRRHWFGAGLLGAAHLISDQDPPDHPFNSARMPRIMLKYFTPYLSALMQRTVLHRASQEASEIVLEPGGDAQQRLVKLRRYLLEFAVEGHFTEVSRREVIHRYYRSCQEVLNVPAVLTDIRRAVADIDAHNTAERQVRIAEDLRASAESGHQVQKRMNEHLALVAKVQTMVEWIEVFLVSVYVAHLWDMFASHIEVLHEALPYGVLVGALLGGAAAALVLKPWKHRHHKFSELEEEEQEGS